MYGLIDDRFLKRLLKGIRPGSKTGSSAAVVLQDPDYCREEDRYDDTEEDLTWDTGESNDENPASGKNGSIEPKLESLESTKMNGGK